MTKLTPRIKLSVLKSKLTEEEMLAALKVAGTKPPVPVEEPKKPREYHRRDMQAET